MNKKLLMSLLVGVFAVALVSAGVMLYYGQVDAKITVTQPISVEYLGGGVWNIFTGTIFTDNLEVMAGEEVPGAQIKISNSADNDRDVVISEVVSVTGIDTSYLLGACSITSDGKVTIPAKGSCQFTIKYTADDMLTSGTYVVKTQILPTA